jgi:hypothetical protein
MATMPFSARQITLVTSTATPLLVKGTTGTQFPNITGSVTDPIPVTIKNESASGGTVVYIGGPDVSATAGQSLPGQASMTVNLYGADVPYAFAVGTPVVSLLLGRQ